MSAGRFVLGVERSVLGRPWHDRLDEAGAARARAMAQRHDLSDLLSRVIAARGAGLDDTPSFLAPTVRDLLPDPSTLQDMDAAVARLGAAITGGETVAIFGDYDVDGAASAALLAGMLTACGTPHRIHIPDRLTEGYGPNVTAIDALRAAGASLLVTVDCGTTSHAAVDHARRLGLDVIVIDHHQAPETLPEAIVVNPNRLDDLAGLGHLCAAGVVFVVLVALVRHLRGASFFTTGRPAPDLLAALDLVALATVADVVPLRGLNRAFVQKGLAVMRARARPGLAALFDVAGADGPPQPYHLGFLLGPRINAGGRIGDAALGARLLGLADPLEARALAETLDRLNRERQVIEAVGLEEAEAQAFLQGAESGGAVVVTAAEGWHPGVVGLIAARLKERYGRPAFAIALADGIGTGSGRSIAGVDLGAAVRAAVDAGLLRRGGGHAMAAGLTIEAGELDAFRGFLEHRLAAGVAAARAGDALFVDAAVTAAGADAALVATLGAAGPFGAGNPEPVFVLPAHRVASAVPAGTGHLRLRLKAGDGATLDAMAFRVADPVAAALTAGSRAFHIAGTLGIDRWGGRERVQMRLLDIAPAR